MLPTIATAPSEEPLTRTEAKLHLRVTASTEDTLIDSLILAARERVEEMSSRSIVTRTYDYYLDCWPSCDFILLPMPPIQSITSVTYIDSAGVTQTMTASDYYLAASSGKLVLKTGESWPTATLRGLGSITIRYVAGYGAATASPGWAKHAMRLLIAHWYMNREEIVLGSVGHKLPEAAESLLRANKAFV
jgi:uncharacterized phiE125 gp8 family phage protein